MIRPIMTAPTLLHIDSSPRKNSLTRRMSQAFVDAYVAQHPNAKVLRRDLIAHPPPFVDAAWVDNAYIPQDKRAAGALAVSDALVDEFLSADVVAIGMPMYNFGMPANVKAWLDQIVRDGRTFGRKDGKFFGLAGPHKRVVGLIARNDEYLTGGAAAHKNFQDGHLRVAMEFMGVTNVEIIAAEITKSGAAAEMQIENVLKGILAV